MPRDYIAFDIETAKIVPGDDFIWKPHRPLGISCIASQQSDEPEPRVWLTRGVDGEPAPQMSRADLAAFVKHMSELAAKGVAPLTWNGLSFDFDILAEESGLADEGKQLAMNHVDMMFHVVGEKGFPVGLNSAAAGLGLPGKLEGVEGVHAPVLWAERQFDVVLKYVQQDVRTTLSVARECERRKSFAWKTRKGTISTMNLSRGWLTVKEVLNLPLPDTSWMTNAPNRRDFYEWASAAPQ